MSIQQKIATLKSLASLDARILEVRSQLDLQQVGISEKALRHVSLHSRSSVLEAQISAMEKTRSEVMGELRQTSIQLDKSREKMNRCRNEKEANAVQRELEELRRLVRDRETEVQKLVSLIDDARGELDQVAVERTEIAGQIDTSQGDATTKVRELTEAVAALDAERGVLLTGFDKVLLRRYEAVRQKRGSGIAVLTNNSCSACYISLPPMLFQRLTMGHELLECPSCHRILSYEPETALGAAGAEDGAAPPAADSEADAE